MTKPSLIYYFTNFCREMENNYKSLFDESINHYLTRSNGATLVLEMK